MYFHSSHIQVAFYIELVILKRVVTLLLLAGATPASVICEILNDDGTMARLPDLIKFSKKHEYKNWDNC